MKYAVLLRWRNNRGEVTAAQEFTIEASFMEEAEERAQELVNRKGAWEFEILETRPR